MVRGLLPGSRDQREWIKDVLSYDPGVQSKSVLLEFSGLQDVLDDDSLGVEKIAQEAAVATPKELLGTHDRCPLASSDSKDLLDSQVELLGQHVIGIATKADALKTFIGRDIPTGTMPTPPQGLYP